MHRALLVAMHDIVNVQLVTFYLWLMLCLLIAVGLTVGELTVRPSNRRVLNGTNTVLQCTTSNLSTPVIWFCRGSCSADKSELESTYILLHGTVQNPYKDRVSVVRDSPGQFDLAFSAVYERDTGNYSCVDRHGIGDRADAEVLVVTRTPPDGGQQQVTQPVVATTKLTDNVSPRQTVSTTVSHLRSSSPNVITIVVPVITGLLVVAVVVVAVIVYLYCVRRKRKSSAKSTSGWCLGQSRAPGSRRDNTLSTSSSDKTSPTANPSKSLITSGLSQQANC
jgi:hypothetical protein